MAHQVNPFILVNYCCLEVQSDGSSHFKRLDTLPAIDGQVIQSAYVKDKKQSNSSFVQKAQMVTEFGKSVLGVSSQVGLPVEKINRNVLMINQKNAEAWTARAVLAISVLLISYLALHRVGLI
jgi:hypothetical protein